MKHEQKAKELIDKYKALDMRNWPPANYRLAVECSLLEVDDIIEETRGYCDNNHLQDRFSFWMGVKEVLLKIKRQ